jgi:hypothetical protein
VLAICETQLLDEENLCLQFVKFVDAILQATEKVEHLLQDLSLVHSFCCLGQCLSMSMLLHCVSFMLWMFALSRGEPIHLFLLTPCFSEDP